MDLEKDGAKNKEEGEEEKGQKEMGKRGRKKEGGDEQQSLHLPRDKARDGMRQPRLPDLI